MHLLPKVKVHTLVCVCVCVGDPDSERLGKRLKGDLKRVAPAIKALSSQQLYQFQAKGEVIVEGHTLTTQDIKVCVYTASIGCAIVDLCPLPR